jgi:hypothetical protein
MKRTTITLPDELAEILAREARRRDTSVSSVVRAFIEEGLDLSRGSPRSIPWEGLFDDPEMVPARRVDEELDRHWADDIGRDR